MFPLFFDPMYLVFSLPALALALWAQWRVQSSFREFSRYRTTSGLSGAEVARRVLNFNGLYNVRVESAQGFLSDHYDPREKVLRLSPEVYNSNSVAAAGVAAHEAGHAIQDKEGYLALQWRSAMVPSVQIGSWLGPIIFMVGLFTVQLFGTTLAWIGLLLFAATALFAVVTLPVEFDASKRAKFALVSQGIIAQPEMKGVNSVLDAAALTYVAGAAQAISTLLYYAFLLTGISRSND
jgi:Zn-dependent membrane protease YugP